MSTLWPASVRAFAPAGVSATRLSWSFTSLGTPMIMMQLLAVSMMLVRVDVFARQQAALPVGRVAAVMHDCDDNEDVLNLHKNDLKRKYLEKGFSAATGSNWKDQRRAPDPFQSLLNLKYEAFRD